VFFVSVASKGLSHAVSLLFATLARRCISVDCKEVTEGDGLSVSPLFATLPRGSKVKIHSTERPEEVSHRSWAESGATRRETGPGNGRRTEDQWTYADLPEQNCITLLSKVKRELEARGGIEPPIMVLQTIALPLGDRATGRRMLSVISQQF